VGEREGERASAMEVGSVGSGFGACVDKERWRCETMKSIKRETLEWLYPTTPLFLSTLHSPSWTFSSFLSAALDCSLLVNPNPTLFSRSLFPRQTYHHASIPPPPTRSLQNLLQLTFQSPPLHPSSDEDEVLLLPLPSLCC
jgi:hypothetical protein